MMLATTELEPEMSGTSERTSVGGSFPAIELCGIKKVYGKTHALAGVDLSVPVGSVFGFLGPNGAGKTTALRILTGQARATSGMARIFGTDVSTGGKDVRPLIGYLPDVPGYYGWMTAGEFLRFSGRLFGITGKTLDSRVATLLDLAGLAGVEQRVGGYSRGMKQRLGIAQALVNAPRLLMLDEPTSALDPMGRRDVLEMIGSLRGKTTVFFSTHILSDVERVCDRVAILDRGRVVRQAQMSELKSGSGHSRFLIEVEAGAPGLHAALSELEWVESADLIGEDMLTVVARDRDLARVQIPSMVADRSIALVRFQDEEPSLEDVFVGLVGGEQR